MRKIIAALVVSVDGFIEGANGELDWVETWEDPFDLLPQIDTCILGRAMYPGYEQYWRAILANPTGMLTSTGRVATQGEIDYAHFADKTPHVVLSRTLQHVGGKNTRIVRDVCAIGILHFKAVAFQRACRPPSGAPRFGGRVESGDMAAALLGTPDS